ncbi:DUF2318 domain-containing protein [Candidatus Bathyarchaeota archaeon]|nr:DUF2318 domain-containing protein [Candidatus Bathyarchaeota archaeon]
MRILSQGKEGGTINGGRRRDYKILAVLVLLVVTGAVAGTYITNMQRSGAEPAGMGIQYSLPSKPTRIRYAVERNNLFLSLAEVQSDRYVVFDYVQAGEAIPMMAYVAPSGRIVTTIRLCEPCESESFWFDADQAVCSVCGTRWFAETLKGISGACTEYPPTEVKNTISGSNLIISLSDIWASKPQEKPSEANTAPKSAVRLIIVVPSAITQGQVTPIEIRAIDEDGKVDLQRTDTVKVLVEQGNARFRVPAGADRAWTKEVTVGLSKGVVTIEILDEVQEVSKLSAVWVDGQSYLEPASSGVICVGQH